jgi:hypothetical protein
MIRLLQIKLPKSAVSEINGQFRQMGMATIAVCRANVYTAISTQDSNAAFVVS